MNNDFDQKLKNDNVLKIAASASSPFLSTLSREEIKTCILSAIWKATKKYDSTHGCKFTSYLYRGVVMECLSQQKFNSTYKFKLGTGTGYPKGIVDPVDYDLKLEMLDLIKVCDDPGLIFDRFYKNMTIQEIAKSRGVCGETIRIRIKKNLKKLKQHLI